MEELSHAQKDRIGHTGQPTKKHETNMRDFLESDAEFKWPPGLGNCNGNHCDIKPEMEGIPLLWKDKISDKKASIDKYEPHPAYNYTFKMPFVVKTIRESNSKRSREGAAHEVKTMQDLRHPHISALLGTFMFQGRLSILIFPAASCDLHQFMKRMSKDWESLRSQGRTLEFASRSPSRSDGTATPDSTTSSYHQHASERTVSEQFDKTQQDKKDCPWPLELPIFQKCTTLRRFFVCLSEALSYLHKSDVRHKDIKPENILVDESGSVILTDFGISRRFAKGRSHVTSNEWKFTRKYASPEIMKGKRVPRDDPSDGFSLGCVFLEMATLLLGYDLKNFSEHYTSAVNESAKEEAYHCNLPKLYSWIEYLITSNNGRPKQIKPLLSARVEDQDFGFDPEQRLVCALTDIRKMLDESPQLRPRSKDLWECFQYVSPEQCRDCDPRHRERWQPSERQQQEAETGLQNRRSLKTRSASLEEGSLNLRDAGSNLLSPHDVPTRSTLKAQRHSVSGSSLSTIHTQESTRVIPRPASPPAKPPVTRLTSTGASRSSSPTMKSPYTNHVQNARRISQITNASPTSPTISINEVTASAIQKTSSNTDPVLTNARAEKEDTAVNIVGSSVPSLNSSRQNVTSANGNVTAALPPGKDYNHFSRMAQDETPEPLPQTEVIIYDMKLKYAYQCRFAALQGMSKFIPSDLTLRNVADDGQTVTIDHTSYPNGVNKLTWVRRPN